MFDNIASIDLGSSSVKMMKIKRGFKNFDIVSMIIEELDPAQASADYDAAAGDALDRILAKDNLSDSKIITTMPVDRTFLRNITFPFSDMSKIADAIPYEAEENIPYSLDRISMDFQSVPGAAGDSRSVILAAVNREILMKNIQLLNSRGLFPLYCGLESNAILGCHEYFNTVADEKTIQIDIGNRKSVINIVKDGTLFFTRAIPQGTSMLVSFIAETLNIDTPKAFSVMRALDVDIASFDANLESERYKDLNISKPKLKKIYQFYNDFFQSIIESISLTLKAYSGNGDFQDMGRIIMTGGGTNVRGTGKIFSEGLGYPAVFMPFFDSYTDPDLKSRFSAAFGNILVYMNRKSETINFLKGEFHPDVSNKTKKIYYLPAFFFAMTLVVLIFNFIITFYLVTKNSGELETILNEKYKRYFHSQTVPADPVSEAMKLLKKEQKELGVINSIIGDQKPFMDTLALIIKSFDQTGEFDMQKMNYNGRSIVIEATIKSTAELEKFKKSLMKSGEFESVIVNIKDSNTERSIFNMTLKQKI